MALRVAVGGIEHETSTYNPQPTELEIFEVLRGPEVEEVHRGVKSAPGGMLAAAAELGMEAVPILHAQAEPGGVIERGAYESLRDEFLERLAATPQVDAVGLQLHGAGLVEGIGELERDFAGAVRDAVGPETPIVASLDLHANNVTPDFLAQVDLALGCHLYPHTDFYARAQQAVRFLPSLIGRQIQPVPHVELLPMVMPATHTDEGVAARAVELCAEARRSPEVLDCTVFHGFMHADSPAVGTRVVAYGDGTAENARRAAREVAAYLWEQRREIYVDVPEAAEAVALAQQARPGLVLLHEMSDNPGGGAPGDATFLLREMLDAGLERACFALIADPEAVGKAHAAGAGAEVELTIGGKADERSGEPIVARATVKALTDGRFALGTPMWQGREIDLGLMARVRIGGVDVILGSTRTQVFDPTVLQLHGVEIERYRYLGIKSEYHFRAGFAGMWAEAIPVDGPGLSSVSFDRFPRVETPRPLWPVDEAATYPPAS